MEIVSSSPNLHKAVKLLKQLDANALQTRLHDRSFMDALALTTAEEQAILSTIQQKHNTGMKADWS